MRRLASRAFEDFCRGEFSGETILTRTFLRVRVRYGGIIAWKEKCAAGRAWLSCSCCCCWFAIVELLDLKICGD